MQLYLIRHAESENNAKPPYKRVEDPGLTAIGRLQAQHLARWINTLTVDALICSPFRRTLQTTQHLIAPAVGLSSLPPLQVWHDVFERGGCFRGHGPDATQGGQGFCRTEIIRAMSQTGVELKIDDTIGDVGWWNEKPRETDDEAIERARRLHQRIRSIYGETENSVVIITHADFKAILLKELLRGVLDTDRLGLLRNTGITKLQFADNQWRLEWLNSVSHLPAALIK
ncbi:MAG: histidine phosphatase family protein [Pirellulaceae bacterium]